MNIRTEYIERLRHSNIASVPPWQFVTSAELCSLIGVHIGTLANWRLRGRGPCAAPPEWFKGKAIRYRLADVWSWAYEQAGKDVQPWTLNAEWLRDLMQFAEWEDKDSVHRRVQLMSKVSREYRPAELTGAGRNGLGLL